MTRVISIYNVIPCRKWVFFVYANHIKQAPPCSMTVDNTAVIDFYTVIFERFVFLFRSNIHSFFLKSSIKMNIIKAINYFEILPLSSANNLYIFLVLSAKQQQCKFDIYEKRYRAILNYNKQAFIRRLVGLNRFRWLPWKLFTQGCLCIRSLEWGLSSIHL